MTHEQYWVKAAEQSFLGKTIVHLRYMTPEECEDMGWHHRPLVIALHDGTLLYASRDDEGNDAGAMFSNNPPNGCFPVL
jgi:hypothetical protein